jgi:WD40 repeat protein
MLRCDAVIHGRMAGQVQIKTGKVLGALAGAQDSIETIAVSTCEPTLVATGCLDGVIRVYEPFKMQLRYACRHDGGIVALKWLPAKPFVISCSLDGTVRIWDGRDGTQIQVWRQNVAVVRMLVVFVCLFLGRFCFLTTLAHHEVFCSVCVCFFSRFKDTPVKSSGSHSVARHTSYRSATTARHWFSLCHHFN